MYFTFLYMVAFQSPTHIQTPNTYTPYLVLCHLESPYQVTQLSSRVLYIINHIYSTLLVPVNYFPIIRSTIGLYYYRASKVQIIFVRKFSLFINYNVPSLPKSIGMCMS